MESANWLNGRVRKSVIRNRIGGIVTPQMRMPSSATVRTALTLSSSPPHVLPGEQIRHGGSTERQALTGIHDHDIVVEIRRQILIREDLAGIHHDRQRANGHLRAAVKHDVPEAQLGRAVVLHKAAGMTGNVFPKVRCLAVHQRIERAGKRIRILAQRAARVIDRKIVNHFSPAVIKSQAQYIISPLADVQHRLGQVQLLRAVVARADQRFHFLRDGIVGKNK